MPWSRKRARHRAFAALGVGTRSRRARMTWYITGNSNIDQTKFLGTTNNQPLVIKTNQLADNSEKVRVNPDGNVGIAKAPSATYKLDVAGTINATDILKNGSPLSVSQWTDVSG